MTQLPDTIERYRPDVETVEKDEPETARALAETLLPIAHKTYRNGGHAIRSVHAKSHGLLDGELEILPNLPAPLAQGIFAKPGVHKAAARLSTSPGDLLHDSVSTPHGFALNILDVDGERLPGGLDGRDRPGLSDGQRQAVQLALGQGFSPQSQGTGADDGPDGADQGSGVESAARRGKRA